MAIFAVTIDDNPVRRQDKKARDMGNGLSFSLFLFFMIDSCIDASDPTGGKDKIIVRQFIVKRIYGMDTSLILLNGVMARIPPDNLSRDGR